MLLPCSTETHIIFPDNVRQSVIDHCQQVLKTFEEQKTEECKAFGLICGNVSDHVITVTSCHPLRQNVRSQTPYKEYMDKIMAEHAIPSKTPFDKRGWVADPKELADKIRECRRNQEALLGTYHMHRVAWTHDALRDTPTKLDTVLAQGSRLLMFIVSMVNPQQPVIRTFYEGAKEKELSIVIPEQPRHD